MVTMSSFGVFVDVLLSHWFRRLQGVVAGVTMAAVTAPAHFFILFRIFLKLFVVGVSLRLFWVMTGCVRVAFSDSGHCSVCACV